MPFQKGHERLGGRAKGSKNDPALQLFDKRMGLWLSKQSEKEFLAFMNANKSFAYSMVEKRLAKKISVGMDDDTLSSLASFLGK